MSATPHQPTVTEREARQVAEAAREQDWRKPSFAKELFLGRFRLDLIHPHPMPPEDDVQRGEEFLAKLRDFCETKIDAARIEREAQIPDEVIDGLKDLGALGMKIDTKYGGLGLTQVYYNKALALVGSANPAIGALLSAHQSIGVPQPLKLFGTQEQKDVFLPRCARTDISAFLLTEPDVGSDPARLATSAVPDGDEYVLDGVKLWTTNGVVADLLVVMARVPKSEGHKGGITAFVVEAGSEGVTVENRNAFMGLRGLENGVTRFHQVRVPAANRIGPEGAGLKIALTTLNTGRLSLPAMCVGAGKWCLKIAREWSAAREQWGKPVAFHEAVGSKISFIAATTFALEAVVDLSSQMADEDRNDIRIEAALAKLYGSEMGCLMADELVQIRGGRGFETAESLAARGERAVPAEQILRDLRINRIFEGSTEIMHLLIAREAVDAHLSVAGDLIDPDKSFSDKAKAGANAGVFYAKWLPKLVAGPGQLPRSYGDFNRHVDLSPHLRYVERNARKLARSTFYAMSRWQGRMETKQGFLGRIVDIGAELFAMSAACVRAEHLRLTGQHGREAYQLADAFCRQSRIRVDELFGRLWSNTDDLDRKVVKGVLAGTYEWLEQGVIDPSGEGPWIADATPGPSRKENVHRPIR
ncbi:acyl-CoA dehydrogenase family protein [Streptomyces sp. NBC_01340]|uniref:acyl-CoA dehydrogenase family protein n=1 Tax=unclassified Streptomyces TaxID=2593676 RepID=UPI00225295DD|nr:MULTISPECIES: acyl-CoA dehydrogenase family protein [unclassified Streptomyces]MCX4457190.1 acyl-CoA dehydrogenase family protein [Streptomyces sp. NBC_01719]MCX4496549.1 acyl-CoA dehydrogenase family protein [Streptomyces sp. NBC_01728]MCX4588868.1 acyl-CoA dehydrogenase family protein [Streptomyces sp. NBC_01549]WSI41449.1 acyl-CoA dehydrogenase family protein [Streptomyces sp. NBC_01340]